jgi:hypothetical protein
MLCPFMFNEAPARREARYEAAVEQDAINRYNTCDSDGDGDGVGAARGLELPEEFIDPRIRDPAAWHAMSTRAKVQALSCHVARCAAVIRAPLQALPGAKWSEADAARDALPSWYPKSYRGLTAGWEDKTRELADWAVTRMAAQAGLACALPVVLSGVTRLVTWTTPAVIN